MGFQDEPQEHIDVAVTTMAFDNSELIGLLAERGGYITNEKWDKMREVDEKINQMKNQKLDDWSRPCSVFITFQLEEGLQRALNMEDEIKNSPEKAYLNQWFGDESIEIQPASEPSDIIW